MPSLKRSHLRGLAFTAFLSLATITANAQRHRTPNTLAYQDGATSPSATISDMTWLEGHWRGDALGGVSEEIWSPPLAGAMTGMFKLVKDDKVAFYELFTMVEEGGSLVLKLKHFNADLTGWEEKNDVRRFPLVKREAEKMYFDGMTFQRVHSDTIRVFLAIQMQNDDATEELFEYHRVR